MGTQPSQSNNREPTSNRIEWFAFTGITLLVCILVFSFTHILKFFTGLEHPGSSGEFGDHFGVLNTLFTGLAFAGLIMTIILQRKDLALQRLEMRKAIDEQKSQTKQFEEQTFKEEIYKRISLLKQMESDIWCESEKNIILTSHTAIQKIYEDTVLYLKLAKDNDPYTYVNIKEFRKQNECLFSWMRIFFTIIGDLLDIFKEPRKEEYLKHYIKLIINSLTENEKNINILLLRFS